MNKHRPLVPCCCPAVGDCQKTAKRIGPLEAEIPLSYAAILGGTTDR